MYEPLSLVINTSNLKRCRLCRCAHRLQFSAGRPQKCSAYTHTQTHTHTYTHPRRVTHRQTERQTDRQTPNTGPMRMRTPTHQTQCLCIFSHQGCENITLGVRIYTGPVFGAQGVRICIGPVFGVSGVSICIGPVFAGV